MLGTAPKQYLQDRFSMALRQRTLTNWGCKGATVPEVHPPVPPRPPKVSNKNMADSLSMEEETELADNLAKASYYHYKTYSAAIFRNSNRNWSH